MWWAPSMRSGTAWVGTGGSSPSGRPRCRENPATSAGRRRSTRSRSSPPSAASPPTAGRSPGGRRSRLPRLRRTAEDHRPRLAGGVRVDLLGLQPLSSGRRDRAAYVRRGLGGEPGAVGAHRPPPPRPPRAPRAGTAPGRRVRQRRVPARLRGPVPPWTLAGNEISDRDRRTIFAIPGVEAMHAGPIDSVPGRFELVTMVHVLEHVTVPPLS